VFSSVEHLLTKRAIPDPVAWINCPLRFGTHKPEPHVIYPLRPNSDLPFDCRPLPLFFSIWALMLGALAVHVTERDGYSAGSFRTFIFRCRVGGLWLNWFRMQTTARA
jgi:hypothetical protein